MAIKTYRPITPTLRFQTTLVNDDLTTSKPHKPLLTVRKRTGGRSSTGELSIRHQGGGHKQMIRLIDFQARKVRCSGTRGYDRVRPPTVPPGSRWCITQTAKSGTFCSR